jgi:site-specific DNA recombinase
LKSKLDIIDTELRDVKARLAKLYYALDTGKLDLYDLSPRIKELKARQDELYRNKVVAEAEMAALHVQPVDEALVKAYADNLRMLLEETDITERKAFRSSFLRRIEIDKGQVTVHYMLPMPPDDKYSELAGVLPIVTSGGAEGIRTPDLLRAKEALSQLSYSP